MNKEKIEKFSDRLLQSAIFLKDQSIEVVITIYDVEGKETYVDSTVPPLQTFAILMKAARVVSDPTEYRVENTSDFYDK